MLKSNVTDLGFRSAWIRLSKLGQCDGVDGVEFERVHRMWDADGRPAYDDGVDREGNCVQLDRFIREHANASFVDPLTAAKARIAELEAELRRYKGVDHRIDEAGAICIDFVCTRCHIQHTCPPTTSAPRSRE